MMKPRKEQTSLIYSFIVHRCDVHDCCNNRNITIFCDPLVIAEYANSRGDFTYIEKRLIHELHANSRGDFTYIAKRLIHELPFSDEKLFSSLGSYFSNFFGSNRIFNHRSGGLNFTYLIGKQHIYCVVAVGSAGTKLPTTFLLRIEKDFITNKYDQNADLEFGSNLKQHMQNCVEQLEEIRQDKKVKLPPNLEVRSDMMGEIRRVLNGKDNFEINRIKWFDKMMAKLIVMGVMTTMTLIIIFATFYFCKLGMGREIAHFDEWVL